MHIARREGDLALGRTSDFRALILMLAGFFAIGLVTLLAVMKDEPAEAAHGKYQGKGYGPEDFPGIDWHPEHLLEKYAAKSDEELVLILQEPISADYDPCTTCHDESWETNPIPRKLEDDHTDIVLDHGPKDRWCLDCHDADDRMMLRGFGLKKIPLEKSHELCGQCHLEVYEDWLGGVHGRRLGSWSGQKGYLHCMRCHSPHHPRPTPIAPLPPPVPPERQGRENDAR